jgi:hypothetical protein
VKTLSKGSTRLRKQVGELLAEIQVLPFERACGREYRRLRTALEAAGKMLGANDLLIAGHANAADATVAADADFKQAGMLRTTEPDAVRRLGLLRYCAGTKHKIRLSLRQKAYDVIPRLPAQPT